MIKAKASITLIRVDDGENGKGVLKTEVFYYLSTSNTTQTGGSWVTTPPSWIDGRYYWQKIKTIFTDKTTSESKPVCITGGKGQNGSAGQSVTSITTQFYLSTSKTEQIGGSWVDTMPVWSHGKYLWTRSKIIYANPSATKYTAPICDSSWEAVNDINVGGRNLIPNTKSMDGYITSSNVVVEYDENDYGLATFNKESTLNWNSVSTKKNIKYSLFKDRTVTISLEYRSDDWTPQTDGYNYPVVSLNINNESENGNTRDRYHAVYGPDFKAPSTEWQKMVITLNVNDDLFGSGSGSIGEDPWAYISIYNHSINMLQIRKIKMEIGNIATDWSPAPEDMVTSDQLSETRAQFDILKDSISSLVTDGNGSSLMTQTGDGWTFNMDVITNRIDEAVDSLNGLESSIDEVETLANNASSLVDDLAKKTAYITLSTDSDGQPCIELGKEGNPFKVRITNTSIDFIDNGNVVAYVNNQSVYIESAVIKNELKIGDGAGFVWKKRSNGNLGLRYSG